MCRRLLPRRGGAGSWESAAFLLVEGKATVEVSPRCHCQTEGTGGSGAMVRGQHAFYLTLRDRQPFDGNH